MKAEDGENYAIKKQAEILQESRMMIPDCQRRLEAAYTDLLQILENEKDLEEAEEYKEAQICNDDPPTLRNAILKVSAYKIGTSLNCECKVGFRRKTGMITCVGNFSQTSWDKKCQCESISPENENTEKQFVPNPEEQKERKTTEMPSQIQLTDQVNRPGYCGEPPAWEHEPSQRTYHFVVGQRVDYHCVQGFRALQRGHATSVCLEACGSTMWTQPKLTCTREKTNGVISGDKEPQVSTDDPPKIEIACPLSTTHTTSMTDFQKHTEVATTMETFIYTTEYQLAVAGCILLLVSILFLSGLTWQWRW
ncbi:interleukin-2 receptor subunit alpha [Talpa occidentalis]|uniref:interleukin-2 receptor subunit alpha n=1 Tax=Talpa occidentalis TaxID=50954 RepID=UPI0023F61CF0|nr:interleukin-2 receptor subunit alpha [Talpa occidentalis]